MVADPRRDELLVANAGHPAPMILRGDGSVEHLPAAEDGPLSIVHGPRCTHRVDFGAGDTILVFTDGLIERRTEDIDAGRSRLAGAVPSLADPDLERGLRKVVDAVVDATHDDDMAAVVLRRHDVP